MIPESCKNKKNTQNQSFFYLLEKLQKQDELMIEKHYTKNFQLLKFDINISKSCPNLLQITDFFMKVFDSHRGGLIKKKSQMNSIRAKTIILWMVSLYEHFSKKKIENFKFQDWQWISKVLSDSDPFLLKHKWFCYLKPAVTRPQWDDPQQQALLKVMTDFYSQNFDRTSCNFNHWKNISWSKVTFELNKSTISAKDFKTDKQCKERWSNHLNPFLNKNKWTLEEDIQLLEESLKNMKKWAHISKSFFGRTQHSIKNRFICLIGKNENIKREKIRVLMKGKEIENMVESLLEQMKPQKMLKKEIFEEIPEYSKEDKQNIDDSFEKAIDLLFGNESSMNLNNEGFLDVFQLPYY